MALYRWGLLLVLPAALVVHLFAPGCLAADCTRNRRQSWTNLSRAQKRAYIDAELCLIATPPQNDLRGTRNRFEELQWVHLEQLRFIHRVGAFLYWHRYLMTVHERLLQTECGYTGAQPYWDEMEDAQALARSDIFDPVTGFGGDGDRRGGRCVVDGPFAGMVLNLNDNFVSRPYCLSRALSQADFAAATYRNVNECFALDSFDKAWPCYEGQPHDAGHNGVGGVMANVAIAPGDPIFYLHHTYLDKLFADWQQGKPSRTKAVGGPNRPADGIRNAQPLPDSAFLVTNGDNGTETTAEHVLWMADIMPNVTIADVMNITSDTICVEYV